MMGFDWNKLYTILKVKLERMVNCTVGRYVTPKKSQFPYVDVAIGDNSGGDYDLEGNEGSQSPMVIISVYSTGALADTTCEQISHQAKKIMLPYGFHCRGGPMPVVNAADPNIKRWIGRYQRIIADGDKL